METFYIIILTFISTSSCLICTCMTLGICIKYIRKGKKINPQENLDNDQNPI